MVLHISYNFSSVVIFFIVADKLYHRKHIGVAKNCQRTGIKTTMKRIWYRISNCDQLHLIPWSLLAPSCLFSPTSFGGCANDFLLASGLFWGSPTGVFCRDFPLFGDFLGDFFGDFFGIIVLDDTRNLEELDQLDFSREFEKVFLSPTSNQLTLSFLPTNDYKILQLYR